MSQVNCKNCQETVSENDKFCRECGGKIIRQRLTFKTLISDTFWKAIGWDNKYLKTVKDLILRPEIILRAYLDGVRKRYVNPIAFFAIGMTISLITFNVFQDHFLELSGITDVNIEGDFEIPDGPAVNFGTGSLPKQDAEAIKQQMLFAATIQKTILKYFNVYSFSLLPLYAFIGILVFGRKRNNYAEQLVINAYMQGLTFLITIFFFIITLFAFGEFYNYVSILTVLYFTYAYGSLYKFSFWKRILFLLKFIAIGTLLMIFLGLIGFLIGLIGAMLFA